MTLHGAPSLLRIFQGGIYMIALGTSWYTKTSQRAACRDLLTAYTFLTGAVSYLIVMQVFCGMLSRIAQFADVMLDAKQHIKKVS